MTKHIDVIAVAYEKFTHLKIFVQSWLLQTANNWSLTIIHDGPNDEFCKIMSEFKTLAPNQIAYYCTDYRYNDYGHSLREIGLRHAKNDYVLLTNADNYFVPKTIQLINETLINLQQNNQDPDVILWNMIHSHPHIRSEDGVSMPAYMYFETSYKRCKIDISSAIVKTHLAIQAGFRDKSFAGDATYFEDITALKQKDPGLPIENLKVHKMPMTLLVHN